MKTLAAMCTYFCPEVVREEVIVLHRHRDLRCAIVVSGSSYSDTTPMCGDDCYRPDPFKEMHLVKKSATCNVFKWMSLYRLTINARVKYSIGFYLCRTLMTGEQRTSPLKNNHLNEVII